MARTGAIGTAKRYWFIVENAGAPRTGLLTANFTITVRNPQNTATMAAPTVTEVGTTGLYFFDVLAAFSTRHGAGEYGVAIEITAVPIAFLETDEVKFEAATLDTLFDVAQLDHVVVGSIGHAILLAHYENAVWIDTQHGTAGIVLGVNGSPDNPSNNLADALAIANGIGVRRFNIRKTGVGPLTLLDPYDDWQFHAIGSDVNIALNNQDVDGSLFVSCDLSGQLNGRIKANDCDLNSVTELNGHFNECHLIDECSAASGATLFFDRCTSEVAGPAGTPVLDLQAGHLADIDVQFRLYSGGIELRNMDRAGDIASLDLVAGQVVVAASCDSGAIAIRGVANLTDNSTGTTVESNALLNKFDITQSVWDRELKGNTHNIPTSAGRRLRQLEGAFIIHDGVFQAGSTVNSVVLDATAEAVLDDFYNFLIVRIIDGAAAGQLRIISDYNAATRTASITPDLVTVAPSSGDEFEIVGAGPSHAATLAPGYVGAAVWVDTNIINTGTRDFIDGTAGNPVSSIAAALTIANSLGYVHIHLVPNSSVTLVAAVTNMILDGEHYDIDLGGQDISGTVFIGASITGVGTGTTPGFEHCAMDATTIPPCTLRSCALQDGMVMGAAGDYFLDHCFSAIAGVSAPSMTFIANGNANYRTYSGGITIENMAATNNMSLEGNGQLIEGTCTGGVVAVRGNFTISGIVNVTLADDARVDQTQLSKANWDEAISAHVTAGTAGSFMRLVHQMIAGNVVVSSDGLSITVKDEDNSTVLATFSVSADQRVQTRLT